MFRRTTTAAAAAALALSMAAAGSGVSQAATHHGVDARHATTYAALKGGATTLTLDKGTAAALTSNGISVAPAGEAKAKGSGIAFPIQGGLLNAKTLAGTITHSGGLTFTAGGKSLTIRDFAINTKKASLTAFVDEVGTKVQVLDLNLKNIKVKATKHKVTVSKVKATLNAGAAAALNGYFGTTLFKGGLTVGTAVVAAKVKFLKG